MDADEKQEKNRAEEERLEQESEAEEQVDENEADMNENSAGGKFEHSMDDDEEAADDEEKKKNKKDNDKDKDDDEKDDNDKDKKDENEDDNENPENKNNSEEGKQTDPSHQEQDAEEGANDQLEDAQNNVEDVSKEPQSNNTDELSSSESAQNGAEAATPAETSAAEGMGETTAAEAGVPGEVAGAEGATAGEMTAAETAAAETAAAEASAAAAETAAVEGGTTTAASAGAGAGTAATAGTGTAIGTVGWALLIVLVVILIIIIIIGVAGFFLTMPQFLWNKLKKMALDIWDGLQGYVIGMDEALVNEEDVIGVAQYLNDMGYDLVGMGFAESVEIYGQKDENGNEIPVTGDHVKNEIKSVDAPYLRSYLVAENRTYLINDFTFNVKDYVGSFFDGTLLEEGTVAWGAGMLDFDLSLIEEVGLKKFYGLPLGTTSVGELVKGISVDRSSNQLKIRRLNLELAFWKSHFDYTYYSLSGWSGRYGKPFELMLTLHVATMAPDLVKEFAMNERLDTKVNIKLKKTDFNGKVYIDGKTIEQLESEMIDTGQVDEEGNPIMGCAYSEETLAALRDLENDTASEIKTSIPYISSVTNHWFRNVYFEGTSSIKADSNTLIGVDEIGDEGKPDGLEDYVDSDNDGKEDYGEKTQVTKTLSAEDSVYEFDELEEELDYVGDAIPGLDGMKITFKGTLKESPIQTKDAVRGVTNPTTKALFKGGTVKGRTYTGEYYIYDGTIATAKKIQKARKEGDDSLKQEIKFTKDSLSTFTILESSETLDAQFIYRDLKELVIELGYFEREDFDVIEKEVLEWPIPDYVPGEWPDRELEKQVLEYGTLIACEATVANSLGMSVEDLRKMTGTDEEDDDTSSNEDELRVLNNCLFIGDSYIEGLSNSGVVKNAKFEYASGKGPQYFLNNISSLPERASKICIYLGVNGQDYASMKNLLDALSEKYEGTQIYVIEVMHLGKNYTYANVDAVNKRIDTFNSQIREKCRTMSNLTFIDASAGLVSGGYLANPDAEGIHLQSSGYSKWARNIALEINDTRTISTNVADEQFIVDFLAAAKEITTYVKENNFSYGNAQYMPPKEDGTTNDDGSKLISCDRLVAWALYKCGYTDQPEHGLCVSKGGKFIEYCESKEWERIDDVEDVQAGDIVFTGQLDDEGKKARHVFICAGDGKRYDCGSDERIKLTGQYSGYTSQPFNEEISSDFMCAYRVTGTTAISTGFREDLDVIAMGNGKVVELLDESNNLFSLDGLSIGIDGTEANEQEEVVEGREQTLEGLKIKLTDTALRGYTLVMYGFDVNDSITQGQEIKVNDVIGKTVNSDMCLILIDRDKAVIEDIEEYIKVPKKQKKAAGIYAAFNEPITETEMEFLATVLVAENGTNEDTMAAVCQVIKNRGNDKVHFGHVSTVFEVLTAPGQYGCVYKVPGSGNGPTPNASGEGLRDAPAGATVFDFGEKGKYWVGNNGKPRKATDDSREVAEGVMSGVIEDKASAHMRKLALYQVTASTYINKLR